METNNYIYLAKPYHNHTLQPSTIIENYPLHNSIIECEKLSFFLGLKYIERKNENQVKPLKCLDLKKFTAPNNGPKTQRGKVWLVNSKTG